MKHLLTIVLVFSLQVAYSQCVTTVNVVTQSCDSNCNGLVVFQANGGQMPYSLWINGIGPITLTTQTSWGNLCPGVHTFTVVDFNGDTCTGSGSFLIPVAPPLDATVLVSNASCSNCFDGSATVFSVTGGTPPYFYQWSNGSNVQTQANLLPGMYYVNVIDANGCSDVDTFYIGVTNSPSNSIGGTVYMDLNTNGVKDAGEPGIGGRQVELVSPSIAAITNSSGDYAFVLPNGTYDVNYTPQPGWILTSTSANYTVSLTGPSIDTLDFGISPDSAYAAAYTDLSSGWPRCNMNVPYYVTFHNTGFTVLNGTLQFHFSPLQAFISSSIAPASLSGTQITYNISGLAPGATFIVLVTLLEPGAGNVVNLSSSFTASDAFSNQISGSDSLYQTIACSFDPNDKSVAPEGYFASHFVTMNTELDYLIRFQNTGNDTAYTVLVVDTIDTDLDMATFRLTATSHPALVTVKSGNIIEFLFNNIYLPDSNVNEPASHGFIMYRIAGNSGLPDPTEITNSAAIYFDQNPPVITNTVLTTFSDNFLSLNESSGSTEFQVYPNPFTESAVIFSKGNMTSEQLLTVYDVSGRAVLNGRMEKGRYELQKGSLSRGTYFVHIHSVASGSPVVIRVTVN